MLELKSNITLQNCNCNLTVIENTGYSYILNDNKFIRENLVLPTNKDYHLSDGILFNIVYTYDKDGNIKVLNDTYQFPKLRLPSEINDTDYNLNVTPYNHTITIDGLYHVLNVFIMSKSFYETNRFRYPIDKPYIYFDATNNKVVFIDNGQELDIRSYSELVYFLYDIDVDLDGIVLNKSIEFSICNLIHCYSQVLQSYLDESLGYDKNKNKYKCPNGKCLEDNSMADDIDFLRNTIAALKYLLECENYDDAQRIIDLIGQCSSICSKYRINKSINNDCGC